MNLQEKHLILSRIIAGQLRIKVEDQTFIIKNPTRMQRCYAEELYQDYLENTKYIDLPNSASIEILLQMNHMWQESDGETLKTLEKNIEDFKVEIYNSRLQPEKVKTIKKYLAVAEAEQIRLLTIKHSFDHKTPEGLANSAKQRYLFGCSVFYATGEAYWVNDLWWDKPDDYLDRIMEKVLQTRPSDEQIRELSHTDPWRSQWICRESSGGGTFGIPSVDLTHEQLALLSWSGVYDSIASSSEAPPDEAYEDDDMIDGWMIIQRRKRTKEINDNSVDQALQNDKLRQAGEVFIMARSDNEIANIIDRNDTNTKQVFKKRINEINKAGSEGIAEQNLSDTKQKMMAEAQAAFMKHAKG